MSIILRQNAVNVRIEVTILEDDEVYDISAATTHNYIVKKPNGDLVTWGASFVTNGSDGVLRYLTLSNDLDQVGRYRLQASLVIPGQFTGRSDVGSFYVEAGL